MELDSHKNFISNQKQSKVLKVLWILVLSASLWGLGYYVSENYIKLNINPEILVKTRYINSRTIPFPAITLCPPHIIKFESLNVSKFFNEINQGQISTITDRKMVTAASHVCFQYNSLLKELRSNFTIDAENIVGMFNEMSPNIDESLSKCTIGTKVGCKQIFTQIPTCVGSCFSFNMRGYHTIFNANISADFNGFKRKTIAKSWNPKAKLEFHDDEKNVTFDPNWIISKGYLTDDDWVQPLRASGLQYLLIGTKLKHEELSNFCENNYKSYRVIFHLPNEVPTFSHLYTSFNVGQFKYMRITAKIHKIDARLRNFSPEHRRCLYVNEKRLRFFKAYTQLNCELECMTNYTYETCGCVPFWMPKTSDMKVCKFEDIKCFKHIFYKWAKSYYEKEQNKHDFPDFPCRCFPTCNKFEYSIINEIGMNENQESENSTESSIQIAFGDSQILETTDYVTYKVQNFVSDIGGLAGLFLGFSLLSLFELLLKVFETIKNFIKKFRIKKVGNPSKNKRKNYKSRKRRSRKIHKSKSRVTHSNSKTDVVVIDLLFGEEVKATDIHEYQR